jgi:hypothetical protein
MVATSPHICIHFSTVQLTRRGFLASGALLLYRAEPVRVHLVGEHAGATLALEEMSRTASLLGRGIDRSEHRDGMTIDVREQSVEAAGQRYSAAATQEARATALASWKDSRAHAAVEWHPELKKYGAEQLNARFLQRFKHPMDAAAWVSWMLVKIAVDAQLRSVVLTDGRFDGHKGVPLAFGPDRHLVQPLCIVDAAGVLLGVTE